MKLKYLFETVDMGDEYIAVPVGRNANQMRGILKLNKSGLEILECLSKETTEEEIITYLCDKYNISGDSIGVCVRKTISDLKNMGLILER